MKYCDCGDEYSCILRTAETYKAYLNNERLKNETSCDCSCSDHNIFWSRNNKSSRVNIKFGVDANKPKCEIVKDAIRMEAEMSNTLKHNNRFGEAHRKREEAFDVEVERNLKMKELCKKNLVEIANLRKEIEKMKNNNREKNAEIRKLKKENKNLKLCIVDDNDNDNDSCLATGINDNDDKIIIEPIERKTENGLSIIATYQRIKNYCVQNNISLSAICKRNNVIKHTIYSKFLTLKLNRLQFAHPDVPDIKDDKEFLTVLMES
jgi:hypothetical protein